MQSAFELTRFYYSVSYDRSFEEEISKKPHLILFYAVLFFFSHCSSCCLYFWKIHVIMKESKIKIEINNNNVS